MANNYGESCHGARLPGSSFSSYQVTGNVNWTYGNGSRLRLGGAFSQTQGKNFDYGVILNPGIAANQQTGFRAQNAVWTANWTQNLAKSAERALALDVNLSYQTDRFIQSPFADGGPGAGILGFYFSPIPLQYGFRRARFHVRPSAGKPSPSSTASSATSRAVRASFPSTMPTRSMRTHRTPLTGRIRTVFRAPTFPTAASAMHGCSCTRRIAG